MVCPIRWRGLLEVWACCLGVLAVGVGGSQESPEKLAGAICVCTCCCCGCADPPKRPPPKALCEAVAGAPKAFGVLPNAGMLLPAIAE